MNRALSAIFSRRSVRVYEDRPVTDETLHDLLEAAMSAPSAVAKDPWEFYIARAAAIRFAMADALPNGKMLREAPLGILVAGDIERVHDCELSYLIQDCSAAIENLLLAASILGLGACWLGVHPRDERVARMREIFALPERLIPIAAIAVGWPGQELPPRSRYRADAVHSADL